MIQDIELRYIKAEYGNILQYRKKIDGVWGAWLTVLRDIT